MCIVVKSLVICLFEFTCAFLCDFDPIWCLIDEELFRLVSRSIIFMPTHHRPCFDLSKSEYVLTFLCSQTMCIPVGFSSYRYDFVSSF